MDRPWIGTTAAWQRHGILRLSPVLFGLLLMLCVVVSRPAFAELGVIAVDQPGDHHACVSRLKGQIHWSEAINVAIQKVQIRQDEIAEYKRLRDELLKDTRLLGLIDVSGDGAGTAAVIFQNIKTSADLVYDLLALFEPKALSRSLVLQTLELGKTVKDLVQNGAERTAFEVLLDRATKLRVVYNLARNVEQGVHLPGDHAQFQKDLQGALARLDREVEKTNAKLKEARSRTEQLQTIEGGIEDFCARQGQLAAEKQAEKDVAPKIDDLISGIDEGSDIQLHIGDGSYDAGVFNGSNQIVGQIAESMKHENRARTEAQVNSFVSNTAASLNAAQAPTMAMADPQGNAAYESLTPACKAQHDRLLSRLENLNRKAQAASTGMCSSAKLNLQVLQEVSGFLSQCPEADPGGAARADHANAIRQNQETIKAACTSGQEVHDSSAPFLRRGGDPHPAQRIQPPQQFPSNCRSANCTIN